MKTCTRCDISKDESEFYKDRSASDGLTSSCKECQKSYQRKRYQKVTGKVKQCGFCNTLYISKPVTRNRQQYCSDKCRKLSNKEYRRQYKNEWNRQKRETDPTYRINRNMGSAIWNALKDNKAGKHWEQYVDYNLQELKEHLEQQFEDGMSWDNYGQWHVDHIIPKSHFNYHSPNHIDFKRCWSLDNLQPLWSKDNISKRNRLEQSFQPSLSI